MTARKNLTWGLVVSTYNREKVLPLCLELAIQQSRPPVEIIVVDASDHWQDTRNQVMGEIAVKAPEIRWIYEAAEQRSICLQRNQGIRLATADVLFLIDDDSLMYPTCAEEIMRVYEADTEGAIAGVQAAAVDHPPMDVAIADNRKQTGSASENFTTKQGLLSGMMHWLWKQVFLMDAKKLFLPYDGDFPAHPIPPSLANLNVWQVELFQGYRMTFRREVIAKETFEPLLRYYSAGEDLDASYRVSRHGCLLMALDAKLHHYQSAGGRLSRFKISVLSALNQALCIRKNAPNLRQLKGLYYRLMMRRIVAELLKDLLSRRWSLPQARGMVVANRYSHKLFSLSESELADWYVQFQREFLEQNRLIA